MSVSSLRSSVTNTRNCNSYVVLPTFIILKAASSNPQL
ncbi:unnamed protein product [Amoebophrya sp. A25]|nr:unnamed protein product [Amoebophrya sp. A25]|eukprot:GSA25T00010140001.1